jgi:hypothetical protein
VIRLLGEAPGRRRQRVAVTGSVFYKVRMRRRNARGAPVEAFVVAATVLSGGCSLSSEPSVAPHAGMLSPSKTAVRVSLLWSDPVDLDLYVTDPALETVYFANNPSGSGGRLEEDVGCPEPQTPRAGPASVETVSWKNPPLGKFRIGVDFIEACDTGIAEARFLVVVDANGERREKAGKVDLERFDPVVLEFDLPEGSEGESSSTPSTEAK